MAVLTLGLSLMALLASEAFAQSDWSQPMITSDYVAPRLRQRTETSRRAYREGSSRRIWEERSRITLGDPKTGARFTLHKHQEYHNNRLSSLFRSLEEELPGPRPFSFVEKSQVTKSPSGLFTGTLFREYYMGPRRDGAACRVILRFEPEFMATRYTLKIHARAPGKSWAPMAEITAASLPEAINEANQLLARSEDSSAALLPRFLFSLWSASVTEESNDISHYLVPFMGTNGFSAAKPESAAELMKKTHGRLAAAGLLAGEAQRWQRIADDLNNHREALARGSAAEYNQALSSLLTPPARPAPSTLLNLRARSAWMAEAFSQLQAEPGKAADTLNSLAQRWRQDGSLFRAGVCLESLFVLLISHEAMQLDQLAKRARLEHLDTVAVNEASIKLLDANRKCLRVAQSFPLFSFATEVFADEPQTRFSSFWEDMYRGIPADPTGLTLDVVLTMQRVSSFPNTPDQVVEVAKGAADQGVALYGQRQTGKVPSGAGIIIGVQGPRYRSTYSFSQDGGGCMRRNCGSRF